VASITSIVFLGIALGCGVSGYLGDTYGRRFPVLASYLGIGCLATACSMTHHFMVLLVLRFLEGIFMGMGMPASLTLVSEMSPVGWRMSLMAMRGVSFALGNIFAVFILLLDDPKMTALHWRLDILLGVLPCMVLGLLAVGNLHESAVFLSKAGRPEEAKQVLDWMRRMNSYHIHEVDSGCLEPLMTSEGTAANVGHGPSQNGAVVGPPTKPLSLAAQLGMIFSRRLICSTLVLCFAAFSLNLNEYGIAYAEPRVLPGAHGPMPPAWLLLMKYMVNIPVRLGAAIPAEMLGRQRALALGLFASALGVLLFSQAVGKVWAFAVAVEYFSGQYLPLLGIALGWIGTYQLSVETFPTAVTVTGSGLVIACGRLGAIVAPYAFEYFEGGWRHFYIFMGLCAAMASLLSTIALRHEKGQDDQQEKSCA